MALNEIQKKERSEYLEKNLTITECSQNKKYVFISYASDNWKTVFKDTVVPLQKEYGMRVYADKAFDKENDKWIIPMLRNIRGAEAVVAFVSQSYIESYACFLELLTAVNNNVPVVFVSLDDELKLGDTTDQPDIERGVKKEIIRQGDNLATKTNNTSNDIMRAMKSGYTSLSTLLEQDALSKYDISDAFINFFRDASVNKKTINDLKALKRSINSVSKNVFDEAAVGKTKSAEQPTDSKEISPDAHKEIPAKSSGAPTALALRSAPKLDSKPRNIFCDTKKRNIIIIAAALVVIAAAVIIFVLNAGRSSSGMDAIKIDGKSISMTYTGDSQKGKPNGQGICTFGENAFGYLEFEGSWKNGELKSGKLTKTRKDTNGKPIGTRVFKGVFVNNMLNGQGEETGYDENGNIGYVFEGEFEDDKYNGQGKLTHYYENGNVKSTFEGEFKDDKYNGQGKLANYDENGNIKSTYEGKFEDNKYNGQGKLVNYDENGNIKTTFEGEFKDDKFVKDNEVIGIKIDDFTYTGEWSNGAPNGQGKAVFENGFVYEGEWKDGAKNGYGIESGYDENGNIFWTYVGEFKDHNQNGYGTQTDYYENGNVRLSYKGDFKDGSKNGQGTQTDYNENGKVTTVYVGDWKDNLQNGQGTVTGYDENGNVTYSYAGEWKDNKTNGQGTQTDYDENGNVTFTCEGEWKDGNRNGQGKQTNYNESGKIIWSFEGEYKDNKSNGQGTETGYYENGNVEWSYVGEWKEGKRDGEGVTTWYDEDGNVTATANEVWQDGKNVS